MQNNVGIYASQISGHLWAPNGAYDALATITVPSGGVASIEFSGIPQGYKHLELRYLWKVSGGSEATFKFNNDTTTSNYDRHFFQGSGAAAQSGYGNNNVFGGYNQGSNFTASVMSILDYAKTNKNKVTRTSWGVDDNGSGYVGITSGAWRNTSAINSIIITFSGSGTVAQYSQFALYGVK